MNEQLEEAVKAVALKAKKTEHADEALKFTQAALNAAHAIAVLKSASK
jgi:hypothetical protein